MLLKLFELIVNIKTGQLKCAPFEKSVIDSLNVVRTSVAASEVTQKNKTGG